MNQLVEKIKKDKDLGPALIILAGLVLLALRLALCSGQRLFLWPAESALDDMLMYNGAVSITQGNWLGQYGYLTLSKHSFFSLWLAVLHWLRVPYLMGTQLLWAGAAALAAWALRPVFKRRWAALLLYAALLFIPSMAANPVPNGYIMRVYRDTIFPALCLIVVAGVVGYALRFEDKLLKSIGWLAAAGLALAAAWLTREDGWWLLPFVAAGLGVTAVFVLRNSRQSAGQRLARVAAMLLPVALLAGGILAWCGMNQAHYGRFIVNDFSSGEFADAYGAMTRIEHEEWDPTIAVPLDVREQLYRHVPAFAELEPYLESEWYLGRYAGGGDYQSGAFYWALREAAGECGHYASAQASQAYFEGLARDINALCDDGTLKAGARRSSVSPPIRAEYVWPVVKEGAYSLGFSAIFEQCDPLPIFSPASNSADYYEETIAPMEAFLHDRAQTSTLENSTEPYLNQWQSLCFDLLGYIRTGYSVALPVMLGVALLWQVMGGIAFFKRLKARQRASFESLLWVVGLGILFCILLRAFMIAYVTVSSFEIGTYVMYLAPIHPLMVLYAAVGISRRGLLVFGTIGGKGRQAAGPAVAGEDS